MSTKPYATPRHADEYVEIGVVNDEKPRDPTPLFYLKANECADLIREINRALEKLVKGRP